MMHLFNLLSYTVKPLFSNAFWQGRQHELTIRLPFLHRSTKWVSVKRRTRRRRTTDHGQLTTNN
jgi:hypothetical protein